MAVKSNIALYAIHTNLDNVLTGVNRHLGVLLGCAPDSLRILRPMGAKRKWKVFVPTDHAESVRHAMAEAGAGHIGRYDHCSFAAEGTGIQAQDGATPHVGSIGELHREPETRWKWWCRGSASGAVHRAMQEPIRREEVAFDRVALENGRDDLGAGMVGEHARTHGVGSLC